MKTIIRVLAFALCASVATQAEILSVMVSPWGNDQGGANSPEPLYGMMTGLKGRQLRISNTPGVAYDIDTIVTNPAGGSATYRVTFSDHPQWGDVSFDLTLTAADGSGAGGLLYNGRKKMYWTVDTGDNSAHGTAEDEDQDEARIRSGESISFVVSNLHSKGNVVSFVGFTGLEISQNGSFNKRTGVFAGADDGVKGPGAGGRVRELRFRLKIEPHVATIPETHTFALVCGVLALGCGIVGRRQSSSKNAADNC